MINNIGLEIGQEFKNYKAICSYLNEDIKGGKSKQLQEKDWKRYFNWIKQGQKYIISEVYTIPKEKIDGRGKHNNHKGSNGNNDKFGRGLDELIKARLLLCKKIDGTLKDIMTNQLFIFDLLLKECEDNINNKTKLTMEKWNIREYFMDQYIKTAKNITKEKFERALNRLQKQGIIKWNTYYMCVTCDGKAYEIDGYLCDRIEDCKLKALETMDIPYSKIFSVYVNKNKNAQFNDLILEYMLEDEVIMAYLDECEPYRIWKQYSITLLDDGIITKAEEELQDIRLDIYRKLITLIHTKLNKIKFTNEKGYEIYTWQTQKASREVNIMDEIFWKCYDKNYFDDTNVNFSFVDR